MPVLTYNSSAVFPIFFPLNNTLETWKINSSHCKRIQPTVTTKFTRRRELSSNANAIVKNQWNEKAVLDRLYGPLHQRINGKMKFF